MTYQLKGSNAIIIGQAPSRGVEHSTRRLLPSSAVHNARQPVPRRIPNEFYPTPPEAVRALLSVEDFDGGIWEPACGEGAIAEVLIDAGHQVVSTDLHPYGFGQSGVNFLREREPRAKHIVTNPPYGSGLADAFLLKALDLTKMTSGKVAMLLNLASLCHPSRTTLWKRCTPARLFAIDGVVCWPEHRYGPAPQAFTRHRYVWGSMVSWASGRADLRLALRGRLSAVNLPLMGLVGLRQLPRCAYGLGAASAVPLACPRATIPRQQSHRSQHDVRSRPDHQYDAACLRRTSFRV